LLIVIIVQLVVIKISIFLYFKYLNI